MPIVVSQPQAQVPVTDAQSPDGKIRATVLEGTAGVFIRVDYTSMLTQVGYTWPNPFRVTIWRQLPGKDPEPVRGAANIQQYGAIFHAYDDEVTFGQQVVYWAEAPTRDGGEIVETDKVVVLTWEPDGGFTQPGVWIKNLENPDLSVPARCIDWSAGSWASRNATADIWGASQPAVTTDVRKSYNTKMTILTADEDEYQALLAAIDASVVYVVGLERHRRRTGYYLVGDIAPSRIGRAASPYDSWDIGLTGMGRPESAGHSLTVPGKTYGDRKRAYGSYRAVEESPGRLGGPWRNLVLNPSAELTFTTESSGYGSNNTRDRVNTESKFGSYSFQHTISVNGADGGTNWNLEPVTGGQQVSAGVWVKIPASGVTALQLWFRSGTTTLSTVNVLGQAVPGQWARVTGSYTMTAGQTVDRIAVVATAGTAPVVWWADGAMAVVGSTLPAYGDPSIAEGWRWEGADFASPSRYGRSYAMGTEPY
ncbi:hypothetical protein SEA_LAZERLEMON_26 [Streptomyces phage LazerLemon]|nr:hypothetical protein SEA_LAZERLEMON_26 [Streptomyces phage LazerLemon]